MNSSSRFFDLRWQGDTALLTVLLPRMSEEENLEQLDEDWYDLIEKQYCRKMVLDLSNVRYMTSAAIGRMIGLHRELIRQEGQLVLCSLQREVIQTLETSRLITYFKVAPNSESAVKLLANG